eukprot:752736-Hanusia_phi.AAC.2
MSVGDGEGKKEGGEKGTKRRERREGKTRVGMFLALMPTKAAAKGTKGKGKKGGKLGTSSQEEGSNKQGKDKTKKKTAKSKKSGKEVDPQWAGKLFLNRNGIGVQVYVPHGSVEENIKLRAQVRDFDEKKDTQFYPEAARIVSAVCELSSEPPCIPFHPPVLVKLVTMSSSVLLLPLSSPTRISHSHLPLSSLTLILLPLLSPSSPRPLVSADNFHRLSHQSASWDSGKLSIIYLQEPDLQEVDSEPQNLSYTKVVLSLPPPSHATLSARRSDVQPAERGGEAEATGQTDCGRCLDEWLGPGDSIETSLPSPSSVLLSIPSYFPPFLLLPLLPLLLSSLLSQVYTSLEIPETSPELLELEMHARRPVEGRVLLFPKCR